MDQSLEEIIKAKKSARGRGGRGRGGSRGKRGGRGGSLGSGQTVAKSGGAKPSRQPTGQSQTRSQQPRGGGSRGGRRGGGRGGGLVKLMISNLDYGVSNEDVKELFAEFGRLVRSELHYDKSGHSLGTATVVYSKVQDAQKAFKQYHDVPLDGRPMTIQVISDEIKMTKNTPSVKQRVELKQPGQEGTGKERGKGKRRGKGQGKAAKIPAPTAEELDADLDTYKKAETIDT